jgi:ribosomal protein L3
VLIDADRNLIGLHGAVPGSKGSVVMVKESRKQASPSGQGQQQ